ncbi:Flagellar hook-length control protein FliK [Planctomycetes bacterium Pan216]|uniref:Flagellar hook-length control protein FliK n=1 Tax=Kolteria novifilia TaxID=2527975 RepID=A0A518BD52_9BACT|nr:Flagellar hook-length control protein FliK [Planctomycetes bacterium Pan216]
MTDFLPEQAMTRATLVNQDAVFQLTQRTDQTGRSNGALGRLQPGDIVRAVVTRTLGNGLFGVSIRGNEFVTSSGESLTPGQVLTLQVGDGSSRGTPGLVAEAGSPEARPQGAGLENEGIVDQQARRAVQGEQLRLPTSGRTGPILELRVIDDTSRAAPAAPTDEAASAPSTSPLVRPDGALDRLLARRPELAPRITELLNDFQNRPPGLGGQLRDLTGLISRVVQSNDPAGQTNLAESLGRLSSQLLQSQTLENPSELSRFLSDRLLPLARGLEGNVVRATTGATVSNTSTAPTLSETTEGATNAARTVVAQPPIPEGTSEAADRGTLREAIADIRNQLATVREQLTAYASREPGTSAPMQEALERVDLVRNLLDMKAQLQDLSRNQQEPSTIVQQTLARVALARNALSGLSQITTEARGSALPSSPGVQTTAAGLSGAPLSRAAIDALTLANATATETRPLAQPADPQIVSADAQHAPPPESTEARPEQQAALATNRADTPTPGGSATSSETSTARPESVAFQNDLKGQLLELRSSLQELAAHSSPSGGDTIREALAQTDQLVHQLTSQQVRNAEAPTHYQFVELPVDPRSGIDEARLHVFYRERGQAEPPSENDPFTVALFLNMTRLGDVLATLTSVGPAIAVSFAVENSEIESILGEQADDLRELLQQAGHQGATVTVRQKGRVTEPTPTEDLDDLWQAFLALVPDESDPGQRLNQEA